jgi:anthranilate/para-aminobenzoate synthase component I
LVSDDLLCKIADFGLSRSLENDGKDGEYNMSVSVSRKDLKPFSYKVSFKVSERFETNHLI